MRKLVKYLALALCALAGAAGMYLFGWRGLALVLLAEGAFALWMCLDLEEHDRLLVEETYQAILDEVAAAMEDAEDEHRE